MIFDRSPQANSRFNQSRSAMVSAAAHALALLALFGVFHFAPARAPYRLPGTALGVRSISYFAPGSVTHVPAPTPAPPVVRTVAPTPPPVETAAPAPSQQAAAEAGTGSAALSGHGQGNISIALQKVFPYPTLQVPHGTHGDVILNAVIDEHGVISELTVVQGLSPDLDQQVLAIVRGWTYSPATRDGVPVVSEQELRFHYERG